MSRNHKETVQLDKSQIRELLDDALHKKGITRKDLSEGVGQKPQTLYNVLSKAAGPISIDTLRKWCTFLDYPIDDFLAGRKYVAPNSIEDILRKVERLEETVQRLSEKVELLIRNTGYGE